MKSGEKGDRLRGVGVMHKGGKSGYDERLMWEEL